MGNMAKGVRLLYYLYKVKDEPLGDYAKAVESKLGRFVRLVDPDEYTLMINFKSFLGASREAHVIEIRDDVNRWFYITEPTKDLEKPKAAYKYEVEKEGAFDAVFKEIAEGRAHRGSGVDKFSAALQLLLWGGFVLLSYLGYKNDELRWVNNFFPSCHSSRALSRGSGGATKRKSGDGSGTPRSYRSA